jgi:hypothetical protein
MARRGLPARKRDAEEGEMARVEVGANGDEVELGVTEEARSLLRNSGARGAFALGLRRESGLPRPMVATR